MSRKAPENPANSAETVQLGRFRFDPIKADLRAQDGSHVALRSQSPEVLRILAFHAGDVVAKDDLMAAVWGNTSVTDDSFVQCISDIRRALGDSDQS